MESELPTFGPKTAEAKVDDFNASTLDLVLKQLGYSKGDTAAMRVNAGGSEVWNFDWFNEQGLIAPYVLATRVFKFDLSEAFFRPTRSALIKEYLQLKETVPEERDDFVMIFKVTDWGRMVATTLPLTTQRHIHVPVQQHVVRIAVMEDFFKQWRSE